MIVLPRQLSGVPVHMWMWIALRAARLVKSVSHQCSAVLVGMLIWLGPVEAQAGTATANLAVSMTITASCTINAATLAFPSTPGTNLIASAVTASSTVSVTCTNTAPYTVGMDNGANASGSQRRMISGGNFISYGIYLDIARTQPWTTGATNSTCTTAG